MSKEAPKGTNHGKALVPADHEAIRQLYAVYHNKREVARRMGVCEKTVHNVLNDVSSRELDKARAEAHLDLAGRVQGVVGKVIDKLEDDEKLDNASTGQLGILMGIGIDKIQKMHMHARELRAEAGTAGLLTPQSIEALKASILNKTSKLEVLGFKIKMQAPDLADRLEETLQVAEIMGGKSEEQEPEKSEQPAEKELDFYNAGASHTPDGRLPDEKSDVDRTDEGPADES